MQVEVPFVVQEWLSVCAAVVLTLCLMWRVRS